MQSRSAQHLTTTVSSLILITAVATITSASPAIDSTRAEAVVRLEALVQADVTVKPSTGAVRLVRFQPGSVVGDGETPMEKAELFLLRHGKALGIDAPSLELEQPRQTIDRLGHTHLIFDQVHRGVRVFGARMSLHFDYDGELIALSGSYLPGIPDNGIVQVEPTVTSDEARDRARLIVAKNHAVNPYELSVPVTELVVFHDGAIWGREGEYHLAWRLEVAGANLKEYLFLDARNGRLLEQISGLEHINRKIYVNDANNLVWQEGDPLPYTGSGGFRDVEINNLIEVAEETYNLFANISGGSFLSWTGSDSSMRSFYDRSGMNCPNAYFNGSSTSFCVGTATDDIVAHEWTHGYTSKTHGLVYAWQSGALNESYSDIFGEVVDLLNDSGTDQPGSIRSPNTCSAATSTSEAELEIREPSALAGSMEVGSADFNPPPPWSATGTVELGDDGNGSGNDGCEPLVDFTPGNIALVTMGACSDRFLTPASHAEAAGAIGVIVVNPANDNLTTMAGTGALTIPSVFLGKSDGTILRNALDEGIVVNLSAGGSGSYRWLIGEDSPSFGGAIRDMWSPECLYDPGSVFSDRYYCGKGDNGGVHINSGVPNHAFAMLVDGGSANGIEVPAIGMTRAAHIYWRAMTEYQAPLSDFRDHADSVTASCRDLVGAPLPDLVTGNVAPTVITLEHCMAVEAAMTASQMRDWPSQCHFDTILDPDPPSQPGDLEVFYETFDDEPAGWIRTNDGVHAEYESRDWVWSEALPDGGDGGAYYAIDSPELGNCRSGSDDQSGVMHLDSPAITLPLGTRPFLLFDHYVATEEQFDGGNLKISVNGGAFDEVPSTAFLFNSYNAVLTDAQSNDNPMAGQEAFSGTNATTYRGSWGQSHVDLSEHAGSGDSIVLRFDFGTDGCNGQDGWYVDTVKVVMNPRERAGGSRVRPSP